MKYLKLVILTLAVIAIPFGINSRTYAQGVSVSSRTNAYGVTIKEVYYLDYTWQIQVTHDKPGHQVRAMLWCSNGEPYYGNIVRRAGKASGVDCEPSEGHADPAWYEWQVNTGTAKHPHWHSILWGSSD